MWINFLDQLGKYLGERLLGYVVRVYFALWEAAKLYHSACCSWFSLVVAFIYFGTFSHSNMCVMIFHCFNMCFCTDRWYWTSFHVNICHLYIFLGEGSVYIFCVLVEFFLFFFSSFFKIFYWPIVDLQCCVSFCCTGKGIIHTYTYIHRF